MATRDQDWTQRGVSDLLEKLDTLTESLTHQRRELGDLPGIVNKAITSTGELARDLRRAEELATSVANKFAEYRERMSERVALLEQRVAAAEEKARAAALAATDAAARRANAFLAAIGTVAGTVVLAVIFFAWNASKK